MLTIIQFHYKNNYNEEKMPYIKKIAPKLIFMMYKKGIVYFATTIDNYSV